MVELRQWRKGDQRAPHKPLLLLLALGAWQNERILRWSAVKQELGSLIEQFTTSSKRSASYPFIRLQSDGLWHVEGFESTKGDARVSELNEVNPIGKLSAEIVSRIENNPSAFKELVESILDEFPSGLHSELLDCVQIQLHSSTSSPQNERNRDPDFRRVVLNAYSQACSVCGYGGRMDGTTAGLEAAHIQWHAFKGPDTVNNGMALCSIHHKLFDLGSFAIDDTMRLIISSRANGPGLDGVLFKHAKQQIDLPRLTENHPSQEYFNWHRREVFKT